MLDLCSKNLVLKKVKIYLKAFFETRPLPSSGLGPYLFGIFCLSPEEISFKEINKKSYDDSRLIWFYKV